MARLASMTANSGGEDDLLTAVDEAAAFDRHATMVSRRRTTDPNHPVHHPDAPAWVLRIGRSIHARAPRRLLATYWASVPTGAGRPPKAQPAEENADV